MPRRCTVCDHEQREAIDAAIVGGGSSREIGALFRVSRHAVERHAQNHLPRTLVQAQAVAEVVAGDTLLDKITTLEGEARQLKDRAERAGDVRTALVAVRELCRIVELQARLVGELKDQQVNILIHPHWIAVRAEMVAALRPYPEAQQAVSAALLRLDV